jgi:O-glycosyl hydrolase
MALVLAGGVLIPLYAQSPIAISTATEYQTIDGMGATVKPAGPISGTPVALHDSLGSTFIRYQIYASEMGIEATANDNSDPNVFDTTKLASAAMTTFCNGIRTYHQAYPDFKFVISEMTPPSWMKDMSRDSSATCSDGAGQCGGHLRADMYAEFAEYLVTIIKRIKQLTGVDIYALSIQNEPAFVEWYVSCVYTPDEYAAAFKVVGARFRQEGLTTKFFAAEDMTDQFTGRAYLGNIVRDTASRSYLYAFATHGYAANGTTPTTATITQWSTIKRAAATYGHKVWMTETSGYPDDWATAIGYADGLYVGLKYGQISGWIWDTDGGSSCDNNYALMCNNQHTNRSRVTKHFYAFVRPDAVMVNATPQDTSIHVVAFNQKASQTLTAVIVNLGAAKTVSMTGANLPANWTKYTTSASKHLANEGSVSGASIALDANSVVSLTGTYTVGVRQPLRIGQGNSPGGRTLTFGIDGRLWRGAGARHVAPGVYVVQGQGVRQQRVAVQLP